MDDFAATSRVAYVDHILQIKVFRERRQIVSIVVHVVAVAGLGRPPVAAPVVSDDAKALAEEEQPLRVPIVRREGPPMAEHDRF
jgi:hypothetical protein